MKSCLNYLLIIWAWKEILENGPFVWLINLSDHRELERQKVNSSLSHGYKVFSSCIKRVSNLSINEVVKSVGKGKLENSSLTLPHLLCRSVILRNDRSLHPDGLQSWLTNHVYCLGEFPPVIIFGIKKCASWRSLRMEAHSNLVIALTSQVQVNFKGFPLQVRLKPGGYHRYGVAVELWLDSWHLHLKCLKLLQSHSFLILIKQLNMNHRNLFASYCTLLRQCKLWVLQAD